MGMQALSANSTTLLIFFACISPIVPEKTEKSWEKQATLLPSSIPCPATTPSPRGVCRCIPWSPDLCLTNASTSTKLPSSRRSSILSLAVCEPDSLISLITLLSPGDNESCLMASRLSLGFSPATILPSASRFISKPERLGPGERGVLTNQVHPPPTLYRLFAAD